MPLDLDRWPKTLWKAAEAGATTRCVNCGLDYTHHGASEPITRKLGFRLNQSHLPCRPGIDTDNLTVTQLSASFEALEVFGLPHTVS